jgi:prepilin-type N-terminal cleavage/methylation domain-containing protein
MRSQQGFTLAEVLMATFILSIGLVAVATGFQYASSGVEIGKGQTTATFLAEQRVEQLKATAIVDFTNAALNAATTTEWCPSTGAACVGVATVGFYRRVTTITNNPGGTCAASCKLIQVSVFSHAVTGQNQEQRIDLRTMVVSRN